MKLIGTFYLMIFITSCKTQNNNEIKIIEYIDNERTFINNKAVDDNIGSFKIASFKDFTLYEVASTIYDVKTKIKDNNVINEMFPTKDSTFRYYIIKKDRSEGIVYDSIALSTPKVFSLDSLNLSLGINLENMKIFDLNLGTPSSVVRNKLNHKVKVEKYFVKVNNEDADSIYRYYNEKYRDIDFSFSPRLDNQKKSKLYKTKFIYLPVKSKNRIEYIVEIRKINPPYKKDLASLFLQFKKDSAKLKLN